MTTKIELRIKTGNHHVGEFGLLNTLLDGDDDDIEWLSDRTIDSLQYWLESAIDRLAPGYYPRLIAMLESKAEHVKEYDRKYQEMLRTLPAVSLEKQKHRQ